MQSGEPITVIIKTLLFISAVSPAPPAPLGHNHLTCQRSTRDWQYSEHVSDFCAATRHSGIVTSHPLLVLTNRVAACCRRSANGSAGAEPRLATRRRRRRRTLEDCSNSSSGPKAPRIHTESNAGGCVWFGRPSLTRCVCVGRQDGDKGGSVHSFFFFCTCLYSPLEWYREPEKWGRKTWPGVRATHLMKQWWFFFSLFLFSPSALCQLR